MTATELKKETDSYLWTHEPMISASPVEIIQYFQHLDGEIVYEAAVIKLENEKYLFISFSSDHRFDEGVGVTDIEEFDKQEEAVKLYNESIGNL